MAIIIEELYLRFAIKIIDMAGHSPHQEKPDVVNNIISGFIKGTSIAEIIAILVK